MSDLWPRIEPLLAEVQKPARYIGCEGGARSSRQASERVGWLLVYPDVYEVGLPNQGLQILYEILNERDDAYAERAYAPWRDLERLLRANDIPLFSLEGHRPADEFDIIGFGLAAELVFTNLLNCLDLARLPIRSEQRNEKHPLVVAGGHCTFNPEPLADFVDAFVIGDGEEAVGDLTRAVARWRRSDRPPGSRERLLRDLAAMPGVYVPSMYEVSYDGAAIASVVPLHRDVPARVEKRVVEDLADWPYPKQPIVPLAEVVHDRLNVEVFRGCTRGCRFCQAGMVTRPVRERPVAQVRAMVSEGLAASGHDEVALTSLSTTDYSGLETIIAAIVEDPANGGQVTVSLPSLRVDAFSVGLAAEIQKVRKTGLTFAPEAGSARLRRVINKGVDDDDLFGAVEAAFSRGWTRVKLYFLLGLPTETDDDVRGIAELAERCVEIGRRHTPKASVTISVGGLVPKPHTPFQWCGQDGVSELNRKIGLLKDATRRRPGVDLKWHDPKATLAEGIAARGDRRIGAVIEDVWRQGGTFQEWSELFDLARWERAMERLGLSIDWYVTRDRPEDEILPWDHISSGVRRDFLWEEWRRALSEQSVPDCRRSPCYDCGVCIDYGVDHVIGSIPPAPSDGPNPQRASMRDELVSAAASGGTA